MPVTGEVEFLGTLVADTDFGSGFEKEKVQDGDFDTYYINNVGSSAYIGMDLGVAAELTEVAWAASTNIVGLNNDRTLKGSNTSATASLTTIQAITGIKFYREFNPVPVSLGGTTYRWYVLLDLGINYCSTAELRMYGKAGTAANARPIQPTISPCGGHFPAGTKLVTMTSRTTSAAIYYTTDGSTPTTGSTLYTAPFTLTISSTTTLKAIASDAGCSTTTSRISTATFHNYGFKAADAIPNQYGDPCQLNPAVILDNTTRDGKYYAYTQVTHAPGHGTPNTDVYGAPGVLCYSSDDLYNWHFEGQVLDGTTVPYTYIDRPQVRYNPSTSKYVMWALGREAGLINATADAPTGPWTWNNTNYASDAGDFNFFVDDDGTAYIFYLSDTGGVGAIIYALASDWLSFTGSPSSQVLLGEGLILFKRGSTYFAVSGSGYYDAGTIDYNPTYKYSTAPTPMTGWTDGGHIFASDPVGTTANGQPASVLKVPGKTDAFLYTGDYWGANAVGDRLSDSRPNFQPLTFPTATSIAVDTVATFDLSYWADDTAPEVPANLAVAASGAAINVTFDRSTDYSDFDPGDLGYNVYKSTDNITYTLLTRIEDTASPSYSDTAVLANTTYYYKVEASSLIFGESARTAEQHTTSNNVPGAPVLDAITGLEVGGSGILVEPTAPASDGGSAILTYKIYRKRIGINAAFVLAGTLPAASLGSHFLDTGTADGDTVDYYVTAVNAIGESAASATRETTSQGPHVAGWIADLSGGSGLSLGLGCSL